MGCILTDRALPPSLARIGGCTLDDALADDGNMHVATTAEDVACIMYTSGSSGRPKGVVFSQRNVLVLGQAFVAMCEIGPGDVVTQFHPGRSGFSAPVRHLLLGGEPLDPDALKRWYGTPAGVSCRVHKLYGITETGAVATEREIAAGDLDRPDLRNNIGRPLAHVRIRLLDPAGSPVPAGEVGELHIGGAGIAKGYANAALADNARSTEDAETRWYRSGDLARQRSDGAYEFAGRADEQLKVRGFRIEPAEVKAAIAEVDGVRGVAIVGFLDAGGETRMAAFYAADDDRKDAIRKHLRLRLPVQFMRTLLQRVESWPVTSPARSISPRSGRRRPAATERLHLSGHRC